MLADHQRRSLHQDARGLDFVGIVPEPGRARLLEGVSLEHPRRAMRPQGSPRSRRPGRVRKRPRRDRRGHPRVPCGSIRLRELHANPLTRRDRPRALETLRATASPVPDEAGIRKRRETGVRSGKSSAKAEANCTPSFPRCSRCERTMQARCAGDLDVTLDVSAAYRAVAHYSRTLALRPLCRDRRQDRDVSKAGHNRPPLFAELFPELRNSFRVTVFSLMCRSLESAERRYLKADSNPGHSRFYHWRIWKLL